MTKNRRKVTKISTKAISLPDLLKRTERRAILAALRHTDGNRTAAAHRLGLTFRQLRYRINALGIRYRYGRPAY